MILKVLFELFPTIYGLVDMFSRLGAAISAARAAGAAGPTGQ